MNALKEITPTQWVITVIVIVGIAATVYFGASVLLDDESTGEGVAIDTADGGETQLIAVRRGNLINSVAVNGSLEYANRAELTFGFAGAVGQVTVEEGDRVSQGDVLAALDAESVVSAEQNIQETSVALRDAEDALDEILNPAQDLVVEAELAVVEAEQSIGEEEELLNDLLTVDPLDVEVATVKVLELRQAEVDAVDAVKELYEVVDQTEINAAELAILEAEKDLGDAFTALESEPTDTALKLSQARADIAAAELELHDVEEQLLDAQSMPDPEEVKEVDRNIDHAKDDVEVAFANFEKTKIETQSQLDDAWDALVAAREEYDAVFEKWLGLDTTGFELIGPDEWFDLLGIDLKAMFAPREFGADDELRAFTLAEDDPQTPWNESLIESWVAFYPGQLLVECDHLPATSNRLCVRREFDDVWEPIPDLVEAYSMTKLETTGNLRSADKAWVTAKEDLTKLRDELEDLSEPVDGEVIADLIAKQDLAEKKLADANAELIRLTNELVAREGELTLGKSIALQQVTVARDALSDALDALSELRVDPDAADIELAEANVELVEAEHQQSLDDLAELDIVDDVAVAVSRQNLVVLGARLESARDDLDDLMNPDEATVALLRADVTVARENYESAQVTASGGFITAPFDGIVSMLNLDEGQSVTSDHVAFEIADPSVVQIVGTVDEIDVLFLQTGDVASITLEALGDEPLVGRVNEIAAFGDSQQGVVTYPVTIQTEPPPGTQLPEGLSSVAEVIIREERDVLLVPIQALVGSVNAPQLLVVNSEGNLVPRNVEIGISDDFWAVINAGVAEGDTISMTVVGSDTSQFGGFRVFGALSGGRPPGGGR